MRLPRWPLFPKYAALIMALVATLLVASGAVGLWFSWRENEAHIVALQFEKAQAAAVRIEQYVLDIEQQVSWTALPGVDAGADLAEQRRIDYLKLLRQAPAVTEAAWFDAQGREQLRVSRLAMDSAGRGTDVSATPMFRVAAAGQVWRSPVSFRKETEPYMTIARRAGPGGGVTAVDVNLKFVWEVVSRIRIGEAGLAYVVDDKGTLIAHPDISLVLKKTDLSALPQVAAALGAAPGAAAGAPRPALRSDARGSTGQPVLSAHERIALLGWTVFVESPRAEAFAPLYVTLARMALVLAAGLVLAALASFVLARTLVRPIRAIQEGAARVGAGELDHRLELRTGDELQALAGEFNRMAEELKASYAGLEGKVAARTAELQRRADELAMINSIQLGMAEALDFQAIVELVGDKLRSVLRSDNIGIRWFDPGSGLIHFLYEVEHGQRLQIAPMARIPGGPGDVMERTRRPVVLNTPAEMAAAGILPIPGTDRAQSVIFVPILGSDRLLGCIVLEDHEREHAWGEIEVRMLGTVAGSMGVALENARLLGETKSALERQTATAEVLAVISSSVADVQPVFDRILQSCRRLFDSSEQGILLIDDADGRPRLAAHEGRARDKLHAIFASGVSEIDAHALAAQVVRREALHFQDVLSDPDVPDGVRRVAQRLDIGPYSQVLAPMAWKDRAVGLLYVIRQPASGFSAKEIELLRTFADQAAIAIQNARLFNETREALERQTATAEVLQVISGSVADTQPVFEKIVESCHRLFASDTIGIQVLGDDACLRLVAYHGRRREQVESMYPMPLAGSSAEQSFSERRVLHTPDVLTGADVPEALRRTALAVQSNFSHLQAPLLWEGKGIGSIFLTRVPPSPFSKGDIELLKTFADQAAIAIQNARLFNETREALERQTATAEVLRAISSSPSDVDPVFDTIVKACQRMFDGQAVAYSVPVGDMIQTVAFATDGTPGDRKDGFLRPWPLDDQSAAGAALMSGQVVHVPDTEIGARTYPRMRNLALALGYGSALFVPLVRDGKAHAVMTVLRRAKGTFSEREVWLASTFAEQAMIAIQNARLFHELQDKTRELEAANRHKSEFLANMSHELRTPLNAIIGFSEVLVEQMFGEVNDKQMEYLKDIHASGQHLLALINDVLDLSKIEAGRMELDLSCFDLGLLLEHSTTLVRERAQRHGLALELDVGAGLGEWVADARKVKQAVVNLLANAVKFTPNGGRVTVRARHLNGVDGRSGDWAEISVVDTGVGIAPADQALVFEEFRQAGGDTLRKAEGTGLGLALVKRFVELHGGHVRLDSEVGRGSTFTLALPQHELSALQ